MITMWCIKWLDLCSRHLFYSGDHGFIKGYVFFHSAQRMNIKIKGGPLFSPFALVLCWECGFYVKSTNTFSFVHRKVLMKISFFCFVFIFKKNCLFVLVYFSMFILFLFNFFAMAIVKVFLVSCLVTNNSDGTFIYFIVVCNDDWVGPSIFFSKWKWQNSCASMWNLYVFDFSLPFWATMIMVFLKYFLKYVIDILIFMFPFISVWFVCLFNDLNILFKNYVVLFVCLFYNLILFVLLCKQQNFSKWHVDFVVFLCWWILLMVCSC